MTEAVDRLVELGFEHVKEARWDEALEAFEEAISLDFQCCRARLGRGRVRAYRRQFGPACDDLDFAERRGLNDDIFLYQIRATVYFYAEFPPEDLLHDAQRIIALDSENAEGWFFLGDALCKLDDYQAGIEAFTRSIELEAFTDTYFLRALAWEHLGEHEKASVDLRKSTEVGTTDANMYYRMGDFFAERDEFEQAVSLYRKAIELQPKAEAVYRSCGEILLILEGEGKVSANEVERHFIQLDRITTGGDADMPEDRHHIYHKVQEHFNHVPLEQLELTERSFPFRAMPDIQCAFNELQSHGFEVVQFWATQHCHNVVQQFSQLYNLDRRNPVVPANPKYTEYDIGEDEPFRCLKDGVWLLRWQGCHLLAILDTRSSHLIRIELAAGRSEEGAGGTERFFSAIEDSIKRSPCYRGKVLSLGLEDHYSGTAAGLTVHRLKPVHREQVILPQKTLDLLDRNAINFVRRREQLARLGMGTKKGLLFYGPPGVGKTHTINYLATNLPGHTTLLVTGEQVGKLGEYMTLARLYQPSMVIIEDVDLIARHREDMRGAAEELMLNKLLNEMDGTGAEAEIIFVLTTNRASMLEEALASRPGRIDQAIEFPLPNAEGRAKLVKLYGHGVQVDDGTIHSIVQRTDAVSASFIKELMRRCIQFALDRDDDADRIVMTDVDAALEELLVTGGSLNKKLLGAIGRGESGEEITSQD